MSKKHNHFSEETITLFVRLPDGQHKLCTAASSDKIEDLLQSLSLAQDYHTITLHGRSLPKRVDLAQFGFDSHETLHVTTTMVGGTDNNGPVPQISVGNVYPEQPSTSRRSSGDLGDPSDSDYEAVNESLHERLSKVEFYRNLKADVKREVDKLLNTEFTNEEVRVQFEKIDVEKGYDVNNDDDCFIEALNQMYQQERKRLYTKISTSGQAKNFSAYLTKVVKKTEITEIEETDQDKSQLISIKRKITNQFKLQVAENWLEPQMSNREDAHDDRDETETGAAGVIITQDDDEIVKKWCREHRFSKEVDEELIVMLRSGDQLRASIPNLPQGIRLLPIVKILSWECKINILKLCKDDEGAATSLIKRLCLSSVDRQYAETLSALWKMSDKKFGNFRDQLIDGMKKRNPDIIRTVLLPKILSGTKPLLFQTFWDCLRPSDRANLVLSKRKKLPQIYSQVDLDSKTEIQLMLGSSDMKKKCYQEFYKFQCKNPKSATAALSEPQSIQQQKAVLRNHALFNLKKDFDKKTSDNLQSVSKLRRFKNMGKVLEDVRSDLEKSWQFVPTDMPGDYLQCVPVPNTENKFLLVQPACYKKPEEQDSQLCIVKNSSKFEQEDDDLAIEAEAEVFTKEKMNEEKYSIISTWEYSKGAFQCTHSFKSPKIVPIEHASGDKFKQTYITVGRNGKLYYFCLKNGNSKGDEPELYLCEIISATTKNQNIDGEEQADQEQNFSSNVSRKVINKNTFLYKLLRPDFENEGLRRLPKRFHGTPPTFFDTDCSTVGTLCAFSLFEKGEALPSVYFFSLKENKEVLEAEGSEGFIDFVPRGVKKSKTKGSIYLFYQSQVLQMRQPYIKIQNVKDYKKQLKLHTQSSQEYQNKPIVYEIEIDFQSPVHQPSTETTDGQCSSKKKSSLARLTSIFWNYAPKKAGEKTKLRRVKITDQNSDHKHKKYFLKGMNEAPLSEIFSQKKHWLAQIQPLKRDENAGKLISFVIQMEDIVNRDQKVYFLQLNDTGLTDGGSAKIQQQILDPNIKATFISPYSMQDKLPVIQTVQIFKYEFNLRFHVENKSDAKADGKELYQMLESCRMERTKDCDAFPQETLLVDEDKAVIGCFLDRNNFSVKWFHEKLAKLSLGKNFQTEQVMPLYQVEYPILCFTGIMPDMQKIVIVNLADKSAPLTLLNLQKMQVLCFVGHARSYDSLKISFLAMDSSQKANQTEKNQLHGLAYEQNIVHCVLSLDKIFEKKLARDLSYMSFKKEPLGAKSRSIEFQKHLAAAVKIDSVQDLEAKNSKLFFVIQSQSCLSVYGNGDYIALSPKGEMRSLRFQRGLDNTFYYVQKDINNGTGDTIMELNIESDVTCNYTNKSVYSVAPRSLMALEPDPDTRTQVIDNRSKEVNSFFCIDNTMTLQRIEQNEELIFQVKMVIDLMQVYPPHMIGKLRQLRKQDFAELSISESTITIDEETINLSSQNSWKFMMKQEPWSISSVQSLMHVYRQLLIVKSESQAGFVVKPHAGGRKIDFIGSKLRSSVEMIEFISNELLLIKFKRYWTIMDKDGQIVEIPIDLNAALNKFSFSSMSTMHMQKKHQIKLMLMHERQITTIMFNMRGQVTQINEFELQPPVAGITEFCPHIVSDASGQDFRVCYINQQDLDDSIKIQKIPEKSMASKIKTAKVDIALIDIKIPVTMKKLAKQLSLKEVKELSIQISFRNPAFSLMNRATQREGNQQSWNGEQTSFVTCGDYLCWIFNDSYIAKIDLTHRSFQVDKGYIHDLVGELIDLSPYLISEEKRISISQAPISTFLSMRTQKKQPTLDSERKLESNLLQLTVGDRAFIINLENNNCVHDFADMHQLHEPLKFVPAVVQIEKVEIDDAEKQLQISQIVGNRAEDFFIMRNSQRSLKQDPRIIVQNSQDDDEIDQGQDKTEEWWQNTEKVQVLSGIYKTYSESNYQELWQLRECLIQHKPVQKLDIEATLSIYCGWPIFAMQPNPTLFREIDRAFEDADLSPETDEQENEIECHQLRRLYQILNLPLPIMTMKGQVKNNDYVENMGENISSQDSNLGLFSILELIPYNTDQVSRNILLQTAGRCNNTSLSSICNMQDDFVELLKNNSESFTEILMRSDIETKSSAIIKEIKWPVDAKSMAFSVPSCHLTKIDLEDKVLQHYRDSITCWAMFPCDWHIKKICRLRPIDAIMDDLQTHMVNVKMIDIAWIFANEAYFLDFATALNNEGQADLYMTNFVKIMTQVYWSYNKWLIFWSIFVPYVLYLVISIFYLMNVICQDVENEHHLMYILAPINLLLLVWQLFVEIYPLFADRKDKDKNDNKKMKRYFCTSIKNYTDLFQYVTMTGLLIASMTDYNFTSIETRRITSAMLTFILWLKIFDWLRMFDATSFYVKLISQTLVDIVPFACFIFPICLLSFGCAMICLSLNRDEEAKELPIVPVFVDMPIIDTLITQYLLSLGEFMDMSDHYEGKQTVLCYIFFILATFFTAVTVLNMLIAIMGKTYDDVYDQKEKHELQMKISLLADYTSIISWFSRRVATTADADEFLVIITDAHEAQEVDQFEETVKSISELIETRVENLQVSNRKRSDYIGELLASQKHQNIVQNKERELITQRYFSELTQSVQSINQNVQGIKERLDNLENK